jgi:NADH-quinone oxidoreductase subunit C
MTETQVEEEGPPALRESSEALLTRLQAELGDAIVETAPMFGDACIRVRPDAWRRAAEVCKQRAECDYLSFISGLDWMPAPSVTEEGSGDTSAPAQPKDQTYGVTGSEGRFQVFAIVESTRRHWRIVLKTDVGDDMRVESWVSVYPGADWHEREAWEMFGFVFEGHPSLRHLFLPAEFEGHPLRKDYPLLAREVKPWPGLVDVEPMPGGDDDDEAAAAAVEGGDA